jgi:2-polyprenyl-6-hydroxyphenyl methylase/3-demethylubiquinone-9 3-methyltransferase
MGYEYETADLVYEHGYLVRPLLRALTRLPPGASIFELGCGNGAVAKELARAGYTVTAVDPSESGIDMARQSCPQRCTFEVASAYDDLAARFGAFDAVVSLEVVEHLYSPAKFAAAVKALLKPGAPAIISTPYHGYLKNLALALAGKWDWHHSPNWEGGHIKFWSRATLRTLFEAAGLQETAFIPAGRLAPLAKSMIGIYVG